MADLVTYRNIVADSERWHRFEQRPGDIVISTPPKSGTTWTQMLCALMIFDSPRFPAPIDALSPWLDMRIRSEDEVFATYDRQTHRRFIKTHTPLDGIPRGEGVHYVVVGRDPRDVLVSWEHHLDNLDGAVLMHHRGLATGNDDLHEFGPPDPDEPDPAVRFRNFVGAERSTAKLVTLANVLHHLQTGWDRRHDPDVGLFHFLDYRCDLVAEMERLSTLCGFDLARERIAELAPEAGIERMRDRADEVVPDVSKAEIWRDPARFFRSGATGEWTDRTSDDDRLRYEQRVADLVPADLARWIHHGRSAAAPSA